MSEHPGLEFAPPIAALPNFTLDVLSSVIYNLYASECVCEEGASVNSKKTGTITWPPSLKPN